MLEPAYTAAKSNEPWSHKTKSTGSQQCGFPAQFPTFTRLRIVLSVGDRCEKTCKTSVTEYIILEGFVQVAKGCGLWSPAQSFDKKRHITGESPYHSIGRSLGKDNISETKLLFEKYGICFSHVGKARELTSSKAKLKFSLALKTKRATINNLTGAVSCKVEKCN